MPGQARRSRPHALFVMLALLGVTLAVAVAFAIKAHERLRVPADTLVVAVDGEPRSLDPHTTTALSDFRVLAGIYQGLVKYRPGTLQIEQSLAKSFEISDDGLRYAFVLRHGVVFHDGTPFNAEAVRFNLARLRDQDHPFAHTGPFPLSFLLDSIDEVNVRGALRVELVLKEPFAPLLSNLAQPIGWMVSPSAVRQYGRDYGRHPVGTGPLRFVSWEPERAIVLSRVKSTDGLVNQVVFRPVTDAMTRFAELRAGGVDLVPELGPDVLPWFRARPDFQVYSQVGPHLWFMILNTKVPPFSDVRMRRAVNLAVDKRRLVERVLESAAEVAAGPVPRAFHSAYDPALKPYPHDPEAARRLVREAGQQGRTITLVAPESGSGMLAPVAMATAIQADLEQVGLHVRIETYEWNAYLAKVNAGLSDDVHLAEMAWITHDPDTLPYLALRSAALPPQGFNSGYYQNPKVDRLVEEARRSTSLARRGALYKELARVVHDDAPWLVVASAKQNAVASRRLAGFALEPSFFLRLDRTRKQ